MDEDKVAINHLGYRQYYSEDGECQCIGCHAPYVNRGDGVLCSECGDSIFDQLSEFGEL